MIALLLTQGCEQEGSIAGFDDIPDPGPDPGTEVISEEEATGSIRSVSGNGDISLRPYSPLADRLAVGDVLVSEPCPAAPYGLLRKIENIRGSGGATVLETSQASLTDVIESCDISARQQLLPADIDSVRLDDGLSLHSGPSPDGKSADFSLSLNLVFYDADGNHSTRYDQIKLNGSLSFETDMDVALKIADHRVKEFEMAIVREQELDIEASIGAQLVHYSHKKTIGHLYLSNYIIMAGFVPIVFQPRIDIVAKVDLNGGLKVSFGYNISESFRNGARYSDGSWHEIDEHEKTTGFSEPEIEGEITAKLSLGAKNSVKIYGVAGPYVQCLAYLKAAGELRVVDAELCGTLTAGAEVEVGFEMTIFDRVLLNWNTDWEIFSRVLWQHCWDWGGDHGTIVINPEPNSIYAPWTLTGPSNYERRGSGDLTVNDMTIGTYEITWRPVDGWITPDGQTATLQSEQTLTFTGQYQAEPVSLQVTRPTSGTVWTQGEDNVRIEWTTGGLGESVAIKLYQGSSFVRDITTSTSNDGSYRTFDVPPTLPPASNYRVKVSHLGSGNYDFSANFRVREMEQQTGNLSVNVVDATTGNPVSGATVSCAGQNRQSDSQGRASLNSITAGAHTLQVSKTGYSTYSNSVDVVANITTNVQVALSPQSSTADLRFILSWQEEPEDLDAHLVTPPIGGSSYHVNWQYLGNENSPPYATLDHDEMYSYGPETITITDLVSGTYYYFIYNYSSIPDLAGCGAQVQVYSGDTHLRTVDIPSSGSGRYWNVCTVNGSTSAISVVNSIQSTAPAGSPLVGEQSKQSGRGH